MYCADAFDVKVPTHENFSELLMKTHMEYNRSLSLRLPTVQFYPPFVSKPEKNLALFENSIPVTLNFVPNRNSDFEEDKPFHWPPCVLKEPEQLWKRPISPIFIHAIETSNGLMMELQFNENLLSKTDQDMRDRDSWLDRPCYVRARTPAIFLELSDRTLRTWQNAMPLCSPAFSASCVTSLSRASECVVRFCLSAASQP